MMNVTLRAFVLIYMLSRDADFYLSVTKAKLFLKRFSSISLGTICPLACTAASYVMH